MFGVPIFCELQLAAPAWASEAGLNTLQRLQHILKNCGLKYALLILSIEVTKYLLFKSLDPDPLNNRGSHGYTEHFGGL